MDHSKPTPSDGQGTSPTPYANSCPSSQWYHANISSSVIPFSSCLQSFPESGSFSMSLVFASDGQNIGDSASASVLPMNIQDWLLLGLTGCIFLQSKGFSVSTQISLWCNCHIHTWPLEKTQLWLDGSLSSKWCLCFLICCLGFSSKEQMSFNFMATVTICSEFEAQENKVNHCLCFFPIYLPWSDGTRCHDLSFSNAKFYFRRIFSSCEHSAMRVVSSASLRLLTFLLEVLIPVYASSNLAFCMMYSSHKLNKQDDNIQPWCTPFPILN